MGSKRKKCKMKKKTIFGLVTIVILLGLFIGFGIYLKIKSDEMKKLANVYFEVLNEKQEVGKSISDIKYKLDCSHAVKYPEIGVKKIDKKIKSIVFDLEDSFIKEYGSEKDFVGMKEISYYQMIDYETYLGPDYTMSLIFNEAIDSGDSNVITEVNHVYNFSLETGEILRDSYVFTGNYKSILTNYLDKYFTSTDKYKDKLNSDYKKVINKDYSYNYAVTNEGIKVYFDKYDICPGSMGLISVLVPYSEFGSIMNINTSNKTNKLKPNTGIKTEKVTYTQTDKKMYTKALVNFYAEDNKNSKLISYINMGEKVNVLAISNIGWTRANYNGKSGYIISSYLSDNIVVGGDYKAVDETVYAISSVNVRNNDSVKGDKLGTLKVGDSVQRLGISDNGWSEVKYNDERAYIFSTYLSTNKPTNNTPVKVNPQRGIDPNKPMVALTFDDGPNPISTPRIIATLAQYNAVATFFDLGNLVERNPNVVKSEETHGNEVGSHTYDHSSLTRLDVNGINNQINSSQNAFVKVLGHKVNLIRPPYGNVNDTVRKTSTLDLINWSIDTLDWKSRNKDKILEEFRCTDNYDGQVILMHSIYGTTADAVEVIVPELISKGYQLVTISEMAAYKGVTLETGKVYYHF